MPAHGHHVAAVPSTALRCWWYKEGRQAGIYVARGDLTEVKAAVMARAIRGNANDVLRESAVWEQRMFGAVSIPGYFFSAGFSYSNIWCVPLADSRDGGQVAGGLTVGDWYRPAGILNIVCQYPVMMVRPRQRMLSRRGTSRGGSACSPAADDASHRCHCHLARSS